MSKFKEKNNFLNRSAEIDTFKFNRIINILPKKDEILFSQKIFLEIILGLIKETEDDYLTKHKLNGKKVDIDLIKNSLSNLIKNLEEIKKEKEKKMKIFKIQKEQKESNLINIMGNIKNKKRRRINSENIAMNSTIQEEFFESTSYFYNKEEQDYKTKNFILENKIQEIENKIERIKFLIKFNKIPHRFKDHFIEILYPDKENKQNITENLHSNLLNIRSIWKDVSNKKNLQEMRMESIQTRINILKKESEKNLRKKIKYIDTEKIIPEENQNEENFQEDMTNEQKNTKNKLGQNNININLENEKGNIKLEDIEKLLGLNMNINVNINLNKQYINNHFNNCAPFQFNEDSNQNLKNYVKDDNITSRQKDMHN